MGTLRARGPAPIRAAGGRARNARQGGLTTRLEGGRAVASPTTTSDVDASPPPEADPPHRITYQPGLDGLRAVALLSIFVVHANIGLASGGFLAVSTFFTLSGFLITALLVTEHARTGRIDLVAFWTRRARRLLPASLVAILGIAAATVWWGDAGQVARLRGDVIGALGYVANWRFLLAGDTYAGDLEGQSTLLHFWSLAIEEQFYVVFPLFALVAFAVGRRWRPVGAGIVLGIGVLLSVGAGIAGSSGTDPVDRLYFRTDIRVGELLVGALFGMWWAHHRGQVPARLQAPLRAGGAVLLVAMVALVSTASYHDRFWYRGGLVAYSLVTVGVIFAALEARGPVRRLLSWPPLIHIGVVSYGAYLVHWPLFLWLSRETGLPGWARLLVGTVASIAVATVSYRYLERPIRTGRSRLPVPVLLSAGAVLVVAALVVGITSPDLARTDEITLEAASEVVEERIEFTAAGPGEAPTVGFFGDSTALITSLGLATWDNDNTDIRVGSGWSGLGCSILSPADLRAKGKQIRTPEHCAGWLPGWTEAALTEGLDQAYVQFGPWEVASLKPDGETEYRILGDPVLDRIMTERITAGVEALLAGIPVVVLTTSPAVEMDRVDGRSPAVQHKESDPARMARLNEILADVAATSDRIALIDLAGYLEATGEDRRLRPDGIHFTEETALELSPIIARTLAAVQAVAEGGEPPNGAARPGDDDIIPVLKYASSAGGPALGGGR